MLKTLLLLQFQIVLPWIFPFSSYDAKLLTAASGNTCTFAIVWGSDLVLTSHKDQTPEVHRHDPFPTATTPMHRSNPKHGWRKAMESISIILIHVEMFPGTIQLSSMKRSASI
jgi:hypothetical protein